MLVMGQAFLQTTVMVDYLTIKESAVFVFYWLYFWVADNIIYITLGKAKRNSNYEINYR